MELLCFPKEIQQAVQRFRSHPTADAVRRTVEQWGEYSTTLPADDAYPEANTFYIYFFTCKKLERVMEAMKHIQEFTGGRVRVCEFVLRPTLWPLYDKAFPNYFNAEGGVALWEGEETDSEAADNN